MTDLFADKPDQLEKPSCPLCGEPRAETRYAWSSPPKWRVVACAACGFSYLTPRPRESAMRGLYEAGAYYAGEAAGYSDYEAQASALRLTFKRLIRTLARRGLTGGRMLEVGCGYGYLLAEARDHFDYTAATDFAADAVDRAAALADRVTVGGVSEVEEAEFDLVIANHVIEHVYDPKRFVASLVEKLRPGGRLVLSTPDMGSLWRRVMGRRWPSFKLPEHLLYFDRASLTRVMRDAGLEQIRVVPYPHAFPLSLVAAKLGLKIPARLGRISAWLPGTTLALSGRRGAGS